MTVPLLLKIMKAIDLNSHDDRCCMAASVLAFLNCLRCGEFTVSTSQDSFLTREGSNLSQKMQNGRFWAGTLFEVLPNAIRFRPLFLDVHLCQEPF